MKTPKSYDDDYDGIGSSDVQDEYDPPALPDLPAVIADGQLYDDDGCEIPTEEFSWLLSDTEDSEDSDGDTPDDDADAYEGTDTDTGIDEQILSSYLQRMWKVRAKAMPLIANRIRVSQSVRDEALRRIEMAARTTEEYLCVTAEYDRRDKSRERKERRYEVLGEETAIENAVLSDQSILPTWLNDPTYRQICRGYFLDYLANCPFEMHDLFAKNYLRRPIMELKPDQKIILYLLGIKQLTPQQLAAMRGQTDRNIRKTRDRMLVRIQTAIYQDLLRMQHAGISLTGREKRFVAAYQAKLGGSEDCYAQSV